LESDTVVDEDSRTPNVFAALEPDADPASSLPLSPVFLVVCVFSLLERLEKM
jgi:hypothetical protein